AAEHDPPLQNEAAPEVDWVVPTYRKYRTADILSRPEFTMTLGVGSCRNPVRVVAELDLPELENVPSPRPRSGGNAQRKRIAVVGGQANVVRLSSAAPVAF